MTHSLYLTCTPFPILKGWKARNLWTDTSLGTTQFVVELHSFRLGICPCSIRPSTISFHFDLQFNFETKSLTRSFLAVLIWWFPLWSISNFKVTISSNRNSTFSLRNPFPFSSLRSCWQFGTNMQRYLNCSSLPLLCLVHALFSACYLNSMVFSITIPYLGTDLCSPRMGLHNKNDN